QFNVHGATHYLDHPSVHIPILNALAGFTAISTKEQLDAVNAYPQILDTACSTQIDRLRTLVESFPKQNQDLPTIAVLGAKFFGTAKSAADLCKGIPSGL